MNQANIGLVVLENIQAEHYGSHFSQNGLINLNFLPECHIFIALSVATHIGYSKLWLYGHMAFSVANMGGYGKSNKNVTLWQRI